jgi:hypothetical protein
MTAWIYATHWQGARLGKYRRLRPFNLEVYAKTQYRLGIPPHQTMEGIASSMPSSHTYRMQSPESASDTAVQSADEYYPSQLVTVDTDSHE